MVLTDGTAATDRAEVEDIRTRLPSGTQFTFAVFDTNSGPDAHIAAHEVETFYESILRLLERHSTWAAILKGKGPMAGHLPLPAGRNAVALAMRRRGGSSSCRP